jgi:serine/threonine-protein kinase
MADATDPSARTEVAPLPAGEARTTSAEEGHTFVAGRYELLGMLGAGAMGTVYRARDKELDELVALKVLKKELAAAPGMLERFRREVKLARRVTHRNVARTFDIGEAGGDRFLTMELVDGEMLGSRLARRGRLAPSEALAIARDVCDGLAAAHAAGVLHRDLKPENVIIARDGRAIITDFGIARAVADAELGRTMGGFVGTPAYMAPEQVEGARDLDARADLYALGTMLYELLVGDLPWIGDSVVAVAAARLLRPPPDPRAARPELSEAIAALVLKLMARERDGRYASATEASAAVAAVADVQSAPRLPTAPPPAGSSPSLQPGAMGGSKSIAVLPLLAPGAPDDAYLAECVTEDLVDLLSNVTGLRMRPRGDTMRFTEPARDVREIGRVLGVDVVLDGSLRRIGETVRVSVRLVTVEDGFQLWASRFDRAPAEVLSVADAASSAIARALATRQQTYVPHVVVDPKAQDLYMRGRYLLSRGWYESGAAAGDLLRQAYELAPSDARIAGCCALALTRRYGGITGSPERLAEASRIADAALAIEPNQIDALVAKGQLHIYNAEGAAAVALLKRAVALGPQHLQALEYLGRQLAETGHRAAESILSRAIAEDPDNAGARTMLARSHELAGTGDGVEELLAWKPAHQGDSTLKWVMLSRMIAWRHDRKLAADALARFDELGLPESAKGPVRGPLLVAVEGSIDKAGRGIFQRELSPPPPTATARWSGFIASMQCEMYCIGGEKENALAALQRVEANGLWDVTWVDACHALDLLRGEPEFDRIRASAALRAQRMNETFDG